MIIMIQSRIRWAGDIRSMGDMRSAYKVLVAKPKGKDALEDQSIERNTILKCTGWDGMDSTNSAEDRDQRNNKPSGKAGTIFTSGTIINF
jgi:hypothetical protein